jgi:hypothetical protein
MRSFMSNSVSERDGHRDGVLTDEEFAATKRDLSRLLTQRSKLGRLM